MAGRLVSLNVSKGGMPKLPVDAARLTTDGIDGDASRNRKYHGGPDRAVCLYSVELYDQLRDAGIDLQPGNIGDNFTTQGVDLQQLKPGDRLHVGECLIEISKTRVPCAQLKQWDPHLPQLIVGRSGWMARVIQPGQVRPGDAIRIATFSSSGPSTSENSE